MKNEILNKILPKKLKTALKIFWYEGPNGIREKLIIIKQNKKRSISHIDEPWETEVISRIEYIKEKKLNGYKLAVILYSRPDSSTFRYRGYNIHQNLNDFGTKWKAIYFFNNEIDFLYEIIDDIDIFIFSRNQWSNKFNKILKELKNKKIRIAYDIDDMVFDVKYLPEVMDSINPEYHALDDWLVTFSKHQLLAYYSDVFISTNVFLTDKLQENFGKKGYVIPNFLNNEQVYASEKLVKEKKENKYFTIGYFSGSPTHERDFALVCPAIMKILSEFADTRMLVVGYMKFPDELNQYIKQGRVINYSLVNFIKLQELIASVDVNIAPLITNDFTNCKSELKFFEAAIVNTITIASKNYSFSKAISNGKNGFLCEPEEWYETIKDIYVKKIDVKKITENAKSYVLDNYYGINICRIIEDVLEKILIEKD